ncbi:MAG TPA: RnfABCDGE type electron transport complex subunit G [Thermodesulfobacteriota bacterium]|nr:RnfABCDGE type electron transport complex subunit G [Thermodesulfobacteriota bacterium]
MVKMVLNLVVIGVLSGVILSGVFHAADPLIQANREKELKEAIFLVLPEAKDYRTVEKTIGKEKFTVYIGVDAAGEPVGVAFKADGGGFQGNIAIMVGMGLDYLKLKGIKVLEQLETPGLGNRISEPAFEGQFKGVDVKPKIEYIKNRKPEKPNQIQAITGATISSNAVVTNINNAIAKVVSSFPADEIRKAAHEQKHEGAGKKEAGDGK